MTNNVDQKILDAFSQLVVRDGYQDTTITKIAQSAGVNESTLIRHFKDKHGILQQLLKDYMKDVQNAGKNYQIVGNLEKDLMNFATIYQDFVDKHLSIFLTAIRESGRLPELAPRIKELLDLIEEVLNEKFTEMQSKGEINSDINIKIEVDNWVLLNLGQAMIQHSFPTNIFQYTRTRFIESNIPIYVQHLKPKIK